MTFSRQVLGALRVASGAQRGSRHATWLELLFDLVFVVAVSNLAQVLLANPTLRGSLVFLGLFVPVWWAWIGISYFVDQFELPETVTRFLMLQQMILALGLAVGLPAAAGGKFALFAAAYLGLRATLTLLYLWAWRAVPGGKSLNGKYALAFSVGTLLWAGALLTPALTVPLWGLALALEIAGTVWAYVSSPDIPQQVSHMDERFGLFTLIVLGESILAVATGGSHVEGAGGWGVALSGMVLAFCAWWLYFDYADDRVIDRALRGGRRALYLSFVYGYTHLLVFASIVASSVGVERAFGETGHGPLSASTRWLLCGGLALYLGALSTLQRAGPCLLPLNILAARGVTALALLALGLVGGALPGWLLTPLLAVALTLLVLAETRLLPPESEDLGEETKETASVQESA